MQIRAEEVLPHIVGAQVIDALLQNEELLDVGALITVDPTRFRARRLPIA